MAYASGENVTKLQYAQFVAASLAYMILQQQDSVGLATFDDAVRRYLKPAGQPSHLKELLHMLDVTPAREKSDLGDRLPRPGRAVQEARRGGRSSPTCSTTCRGSSPA